MKSTILKGALTVVLISATSSAYAINASIPALNINQYDVDAGVETISNVDTFDFTGFALSDFGATGAPNLTGSTFTDYITLVGTGFTNQSNFPIGGQLISQPVIVSCPGSMADRDRL